MRRESFIKGSWTRCRPPSAPRSPPSCRFVLLTRSLLQLVPKDLVRCLFTWTSCHVQMLQEIDEVKAAAECDRKYKRISEAVTTNSPFLLEDHQRGVEMMEAPSSLLLLHFSVCEPHMLHERSPTIRAHSEESHACITAAITTSSHYHLTRASCCLKRPHPRCQQGALWGQPAVSQLIENRN